MKFPFYDAPNTATITCCHILENGEPILYVSHDEDDGMWQFLCGKAHETDEAKLVSLKSVFDLDNSVGILKDILAVTMLKEKLKMMNGVLENGNYQLGQFKFGELRKSEVMEVLYERERKNYPIMV